MLNDNYQTIIPSTSVHIVLATFHYELDQFPDFAKFRKLRVYDLQRPRRVEPLFLTSIGFPIVGQNAAALQ